MAAWWAAAAARGNYGTATEAISAAVEAEGELRPAVFKGSLPLHHSSHTRVMFEEKVMRKIPILNFNEREID